MSKRLMNSNVRSIGRLMATALILCGLSLAVGCGAEVSDEQTPAQDEDIERHYPAFEGDYVVGSNPQIKLTSPPVESQEKLDMVLAPDVYPLSKQIAEGLVSELGEDVVEFDAGQVDPLVGNRKVGDIVISKDSRVNWRRITAIERDGDTVRWTTERPPMTEVFEQGDFYYRADLTNGAPSVDLADPYLNPEGPLEVRQQANTTCYVSTPYPCGRECSGLGYSWDAGMNTCVKNKGQNNEQTKDPDYHCAAQGNDEDQTKKIEVNANGDKSRLDLTTSWASGECRCYLADSGGDPLLCDPDDTNDTSCNGHTAQNGDDVPMGCEASGVLPTSTGGGFCQYCEGNLGDKQDITEDDVSGFLGKVLAKLAVLLLEDMPTYPKAYFKIQPELVFNIKIEKFKVQRIDMLIKADFLLGLGSRFEFEDGFEYSVEVRLPDTEAPWSVMGSDTKIADFKVYGYPFAIAYELHGSFELRSSVDLTLVADYKYYTTREESGEPVSWSNYEYQNPSGQTEQANWDDYKTDSALGIDADALVDEILEGLSGSAESDLENALGPTFKTIIEQAYGTLVGDYDPNGENWFDAEIEGDWDPVMGVFVDDGQTGLAQGFTRGPASNCTVDGVDYGYGNSNSPCTANEAADCDVDPNAHPGKCPCNCIKKDNSYRIKKFEATSLFNLYVSAEASVDVQAEAGAQLGLYDGGSSSRLIFLEPVNLFVSTFAALRPPYCGFGLSMFYRAFIGVGPIGLFGFNIIDNELKFPVIGFPVINRDWTLPAPERDCYHLDDGTTDGTAISNPYHDDLAMTVFHVGGDDGGDGNGPKANYYDTDNCSGCIKKDNEGDLREVTGYRDLNWIDNTAQCRIVRALASIGLACGATQSDYDPAPPELCNTDTDCASPDVAHPRCVERFCVDQPGEGLRMSLSWVPDTELDLTVVGPSGADVGLCQRVDDSGFRHVKNATIPAPPAGAYEIRVSDLGGTWDGDQWNGDCSSGNGQLAKIPFNLQIEYQGRETKQLQGDVDRCADNFPVTFRYVVGADDGAGANSLVEVSPPSSVMPGMTESDDEIVLFAEIGQTPLVLDDPIEVDVVSPLIRGAGEFSDKIPAGSYDLGAAYESFCGESASGESDDAGTIPGGQTKAVYSHYIHFDPVGESGLVNLRGSYTFDDQIIGIAGRAASLSDSHGPLGTSTTYPNGNSEPTSFSVERDPITIADDGRTLEVDLREIDSSDSLRVITECVDDRTDAQKCAQHFPDLSCGPVDRAITNDCGLQEQITCAPTLTCPVAGDDVSETICEDDGVSTTNECVCSESYCGGLSGNWACNAARDECECSPISPTEWCRDSANDHGCGSYTMQDGCGTSRTVHCYVHNDNVTPNERCKQSNCTPTSVQRTCKDTNFSSGNRCCWNNNSGTGSCWSSDLTIFGRFDGEPHKWFGDANHCD